MNFLKHTTFVLLLTFQLSNINLIASASSASFAQSSDHAIVGSSSSTSVVQDPGHAMFSNIHKISDALYMAKMPTTPAVPATAATAGKPEIPAQDLYLVMERIDETNYTNWEKYFSVQSNDHVTDHVRYKNSVKLATGSVAAHMVLKEQLYPSEEKWVAYVTKNANPSAIPNMSDYHFFEMVDRRLKIKNNTPTVKEFTENILMFVPIISSPTALITTHLGIAASVEAQLGRARPKGISVDLHSFAAKVMLMRNPERKLMINAPVESMERILEKAFENSSNAFFAGTKGEYADLKDKRDYSDEEMKSNIENFGPYTLQPSQERALMEKFPPLISCQRKTRIALENGEVAYDDLLLQIFDPSGHEKVWITLNLDNPKSTPDSAIYSWLTRSLYGKGNKARYCATSLPALANCANVVAF